MCSERARARARAMVRAGARAGASARNSNTSHTQAPPMIGASNTGNASLYNGNNFINLTSGRPQSGSTRSKALLYGFFYLTEVVW